MSVADVALSPIHRGLGFSSDRFGNQPKPYSVESILIFLSVSGSRIPMIILESDSIANVKLRIQTRNGFVVRRQKLVFSGRELARNSSLLKEYGVTGGSVLHLVLKLSDLLIVTVRTTCGEVFEFHVDRHRDVGYLKKRISKEGKGFPHVDDQQIFCNGEKLDDHRVIDDICKDGNSVIHLLVKRSLKLKVPALTSGQPVAREDVLIGRDFFLEPVIVDPEVKLPKAIRDMINRTIDGLNKGNPPIRSSEGTGGTYLMPDSSGLHYVSVFKPVDEEPMAVNNPQQLPVSSDGQGLKRGTRVGEGALREVAAYILDHPKGGPRTLSNEFVGFAGVPPTVMVRSLHRGYNYPRGFEISMRNAKIGSLQIFMKNNGSCEDIGPGAFPVEQVHKICAFDIRLANADRHAGNILIGKDEEGQAVLIPIDHGYCLPENFEDCTFDWLYWPQAKEPFSADTLNYIDSLDSEQDIALLRLHGWDVPKSVSRTLHISTMLLKKGAERNLTPYQIGSIMCRETVNKGSAIEEIVCEAQKWLLPGMSEAAFMEAVSKVMDGRLDELTK
ncbi:PREDICTED: phosphatidylinositol 4-kinase gamma 2-like [Tarenaya hassleriana]|uniref:phosphatidylinositol 4-kinase gamma 2-like n=1 Tax=Tarenaya hassleriana TaxID=28532 RepID=UPI00053C5783|nr:PREDICTED: phosphatidylinositol 4-kinase gamma 2-like [Tarenaya hassleriana]